MEYLAALLIFFFICIIIGVNIQYRRAKKSHRNNSYILPELGRQEHNSEFETLMNASIEHLESTLNEEYIDQVKERVVREHKMGLVEWENRWFEWKRYLIVSSILPSVPIYSRDIDMILQEMSMFTDEYQEFSRKWGIHLKQETHSDSTTLDPHQRAWFDVIYVTLFQPTSFSEMTWGRFLVHPLSSELIDDFENQSEEKIREKYFRNDPVHPVAKELIRFVIDYLKSEWQEIKAHVSIFGNKPKRFKYNKSIQPEDRNSALNQLTGVLFLSGFHPQHFYQQCHQLYGTGKHVTKEGYFTGSETSTTGSTTTSTTNTTSTIGTTSHLENGKGSEGELSRESESLGE